MRAKRVEKKLTLNKTTIATLELKVMNQVVGGKTIVCTATLPSPICTMECPETW